MYLCARVVLPCLRVWCCPVAHVACVCREYMCFFYHLTLMPDFPHNKPTTEQTRAGRVHVLASAMNSGLTQVSVVQLCARVCVCFCVCVCVCVCVVLFVLTLCVRVVRSSPYQRLETNQSLTPHLNLGVTLDLRRASSTLCVRSLGRGGALSFS